MKIVVVHEWLTNIAGSEKVLLQMAETFPDAEIVVGVADPELASAQLPGRSVRSLLSPRLPGILRKWQHYAPLLWLAWRTAKIEADVVVISSHFASHQACHRTSGKTVVYYHTPMRIAWKFEMEKNRVSKRSGQLLALLVPVMQYLDRLPASKATLRFANSTETQRRIHSFYNCDSEILHPPIAPTQSERAELAKEASSPYYICFGRLVDYKRVDHAIIACNELGRRLVVAGTGPMEEHLRSISGPTIEFVGQVDEKAKTDLLTGAEALLFPGLEDFGIVPVEAMSYGTPVIALGRGGVLDTVNSDTGVLYSGHDANSLAEAIVEFESAYFDSSLIRDHAGKFGEMNFRKRLKEAVMSL